MKIDDVVKRTLKLRFRTQTEKEVFSLKNAPPYQLDGLYVCVFASLMDFRLIWCDNIHASI